MHSISNADCSRGGSGSGFDVPAAGSPGRVMDGCREIREVRDNRFRSFFIPTTHFNHCMSIQIDREAHAREIRGGVCEKWAGWEKPRTSRTLRTSRLPWLQLPGSQPACSRHLLDL